MTKFVILAGVAGWLVSGDWLIGACLLVLGLGWMLLQPEEGPPVIALAFSMQWVSVCVGLFYFTVTERPLDATIHSDYRTMVMLGLGCLLTMIAGLRLGRRIVGLAGPATGLRPAYALTFKTLLVAYAVGTMFVGAIQNAAWDYPGLAQAILALTYLRLGLLYLVFRRLVVDNEWHYLAGLMAVEIVLGITGYYAGFREPLIMAALAHTAGKLMAETLEYVFEPRLFFPDKPDIKSDSEMVRKYSGVWVAGEDQSTDIAFGYAAESYIDFAIPMMFVPMLIWWTFVGAAVAGILRVFRHRDIAISVATVIAWLSLYLFERSWAKTIGLSGTLLIYAGGLSYLLDLLWFEKFRNVYVKDLSEATESLAEAPMRLQT